MKRSFYIHLSIIVMIFFIMTGNVQNAYSGWWTGQQTPQGLGTGDSPTFVGETLSGLTASRGVVTDSNKALASDNAATGSGAPVRATSPSIVSPTITGHAVIEGVTATGATGTGKFVFDTSPTLSGTPLAPTAADNTTTTQIATTAYAKGQIANVANPRAISQAVYMTAAVSGSSGILATDNGNLDMGATPFTYVITVAIPDWTPSDDYSALIAKYQDASHRADLFLRGGASAGKFSLELNGTEYNSTIANTFVDGSAHQIAVTVSPGGANTTVLFYVDGVLWDSPAVQANAGSVSNTGNLEICGVSGQRIASTISFSAIYNRALTLAEVRDLYRNGVAFADKWGSQTNIITGNDSTLAGASNWVNGTLSTYDATGDLSLAATAAGQYCRLPVANSATVIGKRYRISFDIANIVGEWGVMDFNGAGYYGVTTTINGRYSAEFVATTTGGVRLRAGTTDAAGDFDNFSLVEVGTTLALEPEGIQPAPGQWLDSSTNKLHAMQPAAGSSLTRQKKEFEYRWTNTWTASSAAQYIGGLNQAVLSTKHFITSIVSRATVVTDVENIEIGDGSAVAYYVAAVAPTAAPINHTLAKNLNDGTNLKLVVTPAAEATMTIEFIVRGFLIE